MFAIICGTMDLDDWNTNTDFRQDRSYSGGKACHEAHQGISFDWGDTTRGGMIEFLQEYIGTQPDALIACFNCNESRSTDVTRTWRESHRVYFEEDVYHIASRTAAGFSEFEILLRESDDQIAMIGICTNMTEILPDVIGSTAVLETLAAHTKHVFTNAFDGEGYLVWTPQ